MADLTVLAENNPQVIEQAIICAYRGSHSHGTFIPSSDPAGIDDIDLLSCYIPPLTFYFGLEGFWDKHTKEVKEGPWDIVCYETRKFVKLLAAGNPNVISILWVKGSDYLRLTEAGALLVRNRDLFSSKLIYHSFIGYAHAQFKKMTAFKFEGYMGDKRKALVDKFGYDCKNAAHLVRLMRMACEFLKDNKFNVDRSNIDAKELIEIKTGQWSLERVREVSNPLFDRARDLHQKSSLPDEPNYDRINLLLTQILKLHYGIK